MTTMETVTALVTKMDALIGCLGCGEPVPEDSLSDLFCAQVEYPPVCDEAGDECRCSEPYIVTCQHTALNRMATDPDDVYDDIGDELPDNWLLGRGRAARWWPGIERDECAPRYDSCNPWGFQ